MPVYALPVHSAMLEPPREAPYPPHEWEQEEICFHVAELIRESLRTGQPVKLADATDRAAWEVFQGFGRQKHREGA